MSTESKITRRRFVAASAMLAGATMLPSRSARAAEFEYKMGHSSPAGHPFHKRLLEVSERIDKGTNGRMKLTIFPASQLGGDNDLLSQARTGAVDFVQPAGLILASILPVAAVNGMGFAFKDYAQVWAAMDGDLGDFVRGQITAKAGLVPMEKRWDLGFRQITTNKPVEKAADIAGLKLRVPGAPALVSLFTALGASPVSMQFGEVYTSLQTKIVDGQENPLSVIDAGKFYEVQKYCALTNHVWDGYWICANPNSWNRLPNDIKTVVAKSFNDVALLEREDLAALDRSLQAELEKKGMTFTKPDLATFRDKLRAAGFYQEWRGKIGNEAWALLEKHVGKLA
jgi:tripartite ATP-independent transporter DctP family solute receptor